MYHSRSFPYLSIVIVVATVRLAFRVFLVTMELAWYDRFIVRFLLMLLRPVVRLTIAWCHATSFRRSIVRLAWTGEGW